MPAPCLKIVTIHISLFKITSYVASLHNLITGAVCRKTEKFTAREFEGASTFGKGAEIACARFYQSKFFWHSEISSAAY